VLALNGQLAFLGALALSSVTFAAALRRRSWPLWLLAFGFAVGSLVVAWSSR